MISVIIPLYNKEKAVVHTLQSVLSQTYQDFEVVIVNDGSTDNSETAVRQFINSLDSQSSLNIPAIRLVSKPNGGVSSARNRGIQEAKGEYIAFLDADDLWSPDYLQTLASLIRQCPDAGLYSVGYQALCGEKIPVLNEDNCHIGYVANPWNGSLKIWTGSSSSGKADLLAVGGFDERMTHGEDIDLWWRLILYKGAAQCTKTLAFYRQDAENRAMNRLIPLEKHIPFFIGKYAEARKDNAAFRKYFDTQMIYRLYPYLFDSKYKNEALRIARQLDYSQLKFSMRFRMFCPHLYRWYERLHGRV